jgi:hypothetical protein
MERLFRKNFSLLVKQSCYLYLIKQCSDKLLIFIYICYLILSTGSLRILQKLAPLSKLAAFLGVH